MSYATLKLFYLSFEKEVGHKNYKIFTWWVSSSWQGSGTYKNILFWVLTIFSYNSPDIFLLIVLKNVLLLFLPLSSDPRIYNLYKSPNMYNFTPV